jgi:hypothetical protein
MHRSYEKFEDTKVAIRRAVYRRTDNPMSKIKRKTIIYKTQYRKLKVSNRNPTKNQR